MPKPEIPDYIKSNIKYSFFDCKGSFSIHALNENKIKEKNKPTHLMFNMATGTGKTLMASLILHYYKKGYRKFIFFVNQRILFIKQKITLLILAIINIFFRSNCN